jgi:uncharacterized protein (AIM24 family)
MVIHHSVDYISTNRYKITIDLINIRESDTMPQWEITEEQNMKLVKVTLNDETVRAESGVLHYMRGNVELQTKMPGVGSMFKSALTGEKIFRPTYTGTGVVYFGPPSFGQFNSLELNGDEWVLDRGAFIASDEGIELGVIRNKLWASLAGGEGMFQTSVKGHGTVIYYSEGPIQIIDLNNETLAVDGNFAVARQAQLNFTVKKAAKGILSTMTSGEGFVNVISGTGRVMLCPVPNLYNGLLGRLVASTITG